MRIILIISASTLIIMGANHFGEGRFGMACLDWIVGIWCITLALIRKDSIGRKS